MKATAVRDYGAFATVTIGKEDLAKRVKKITRQDGVPIIIDTVGGDVFTEITKW